MQPEIDASEFIDRFTVAVQRLPRKARKEVTLALRASAADVARATRSLLRRSADPSVPGKATGLLARSIRTRISKKGFTSYVHSTAYYSLFLERGTALRRTRKGSDRGAVTARPFLSRALEERRGAISERIFAAIRQVLVEEST